MSAIIKELSLAPDQLAREIGRMMESRLESDHDLLVLGHAYAVIKTLSEIFPDHYPTSWNDHMSGVIELNEMVPKLIKRNLELSREAYVLKRRVVDLRSELLMTRNQLEVLGRSLRVESSKPCKPARLRTDGRPS